MKYKTSTISLLYHNINHLITSKYNYNIKLADVVMRLHIEKNINKLTTTSTILNLFFRPFSK